MSHNYVAIMAGGIGSRFWPGSREERPKQFLDIMGMGKSLIRMTFERFLSVCPASNIYIVTNAQYKDLVKEHLPEIEDHQILCEPSRNNTAPCVAYAAWKIHQKDPEASFVVAPSDHIILRPDAFCKIINQGLDFVRNNDALLTLGIQPTRPDTGYGYIHFKKNDTGVYNVQRFTEKPDIEHAKKFVASGEYLWNAGIFLWSSKSILEAYRNLSPEIAEKFDAIKSCMNTTEEQSTIDRVYPTCPSISVDYAIMEKANNVFTIPSEFGWSDLGTWGSLHAEFDKDASNNAVHGSEVQLYDVKNSMIRVPEGKLVVLKGLDNYILVDEGDVLLVCPKDDEQEIKAITKALKEAGKERFL